MGKSKKIKLRLPVFINTLFLFAFFVHVTYIGYGIKFPDIPSVKLFTKSFNELDEFPISFKLCVTELENSHAQYQKFGYDDLWSFYKGNSMYDKSMANDEGRWVGWAGHKDNSTITSVKGVYCMKM